jgi:Flp pilus assembly protein TadD
MRRPRPKAQPINAETREQSLLNRARRHRRRGEHRKAMLALREACYTSRCDARLWTLYAMSCVRAGRSDDCAQALRQALWLRERENDDARARVTQDLIDRLGEREAA